MKLKLHQSLQLRSIAVGVLSLWTFSLSAGACELATTVKDATIDNIKTFFVFENQKKDVVTFVGYSGSKYEDKTAKPLRALTPLFPC